MPHQTEADLSMIERIERALVVLAYFIELDGDVHVPMYEKFEAELAELRKQEDTKARARIESWFVYCRQRRRPSGRALDKMLDALLDVFIHRTGAVNRSWCLIPCRTSIMPGSHEPRVAPAIPCGDEDHAGSS